MEMCSASTPAAVQCSILGLHAWLGVPIPSSSICGVLHCPRGAHRGSIVSFSVPCCLIYLSAALSPPQTDHETFENADAGASHTFPQQAGTIRKNGFMVFKGRPCKVRPSSNRKTVTAAATISSRSCEWWCLCLRLHTLYNTHTAPLPGLHAQVIDVSTSKTGKHGHAKCNFVGVDIFTGKKYEEMTPSSHNMDVSTECRRTGCEHGSDC